MVSVLLQPCSDAASQRNYTRTIAQPVPFTDVDALFGTERAALLHAHRDGSAPIWGTTPHRDALRDHNRLRPGDLVLFARSGSFFQRGTVTATWRNQPLARHLWGTKDDGQTWELMYSLTDLQDLDVPYEALNMLWSYTPNASPRSFRLLDEQRSQAALDYFGNAGISGDSGRYVPTEAMDGAVNLLRQLIGEPLTTVTGRTNTIIGVTPPDVIVATDRSPQGQAAPIAAVDEALQRLITHGSVQIHPDTIGHRSAFIGAVLLTLPGAQAAGSPPTITLQPPDPDDINAGDYRSGSPFQGPLERSGVRPQRGEQSPLRDRLLRNATEGTCAICGVMYPARFLWAAHIKKRAVCDERERRDLDHVAMLACLFGCDTLFEAGYITVDAYGTVITTNDTTLSIPLLEHLNRLRGRRVRPFKPGSATYYEWHRLNKFRG